MAKNVINEIGFMVNNTTTTTGPIGWFAPTDGSRTNTLRAHPYKIGVPERSDGSGFPLPRLNGMTADVTTPVAASPFTFGAPPANNHTWSTQRDAEYYSIFFDDSYENSATMIRILKPCWLHIQGTICTGKPDTVNTTTIGTGLLKWNGDTFGSNPLGAHTQTNEPAADGCAMPFNVMSNFDATPTSVWKPYIASTWGSSILDSNDSSAAGLLASVTYLQVTRISP